MNAKQRTIVVCLLAVSLLISGCGPGQLLAPTLTPTPTPCPSCTVEYETSYETAYETSFEDDAAASGITATNSAIAIYEVNYRTGTKSLEVVKQSGGSDWFSIDFSIHSITGKETLDISDKILAISAFIPIGTRMESINFGFSGEGRTITVPVREDMGIKGRWFQLAINMTEVVNNPRTIIYGDSWETALAVIRHCDTISIEGRSTEDSATFLVDDFSWSPWTDPSVDTEADSLKKYAPHGMYIGSVLLSHPGQPYTLDPFFLQAFIQEFNLAWIGTESGWPQDLPPDPTSIDFDHSVSDYRVAIARANHLDMKMFTGGWHAQLPQWLLDTPFDQLRPILENRITQDIGVYPGRMVLWDIFNETVLDSGHGFRNNHLIGTPSPDGFAPYGYNYSPWVAVNTWPRQVKITSPTVIDKQDTSIIWDAFNTAHAADPKAKLFLNEFEIEQIGRPKSEYFYKLVTTMKDNNVPIDGVGFQLHLFILDDTVGLWNERQKIDLFLDNVDKSVKRFAELGLLVEFSEVEVAIRTDDLDLTDSDDLELYAGRLCKQAQVYAGLMKIARENDNVVAFIFWEVSDTWSTIFMVDYPYYALLGDAALFDTYYQPKPAYGAVLDVLKGNSVIDCE
jgi:GH35 family endo-1,4-beta-xylanase